MVNATASFTVIHTSLRLDSGSQGHGQQGVSAERDCYRGRHRGGP